MNRKIQLLDCTLRDGAYIVEGKFGIQAIRGIIKKMQDAHVDIIECGWLKDKKDAPYEAGSTFYYLPSDLEQYMTGKSGNVTYVAMIDWNRYDLNNLPACDGKSIDAIRVVFPQGHFKDGIALGRIIQDKGYEVYFQAANTMGYSDEELEELADEVNKVHPVALSVVDTFGAMYGEDLARIVEILDKRLDTDIKLGFHSHNNLQLSFSLCVQFVNLLKEGKREIIVDSSLCGMGRGAGNATTELVANFLNLKCQGNYDMNVILDAIDMYMGYFKSRYNWGYSTFNFIAGMYCTHVNNIAYLLQNHRTTAKDMRIIIDSLSEEDRRRYDYDLLKEKFLDYQDKSVDDEKTLDTLAEELRDRTILLLFPGKSVIKEEGKIRQFIERKNPAVIGVNAVTGNYKYDYLFFSNSTRYEYAKEIYFEAPCGYRKIVTSNIKTSGDENEYIVNFNLLVKRKWPHFDNAGIMCLWLLNRLHVTDVALAGFDGFEDTYDESYADVSLPHLNPGKTWEELNEEIREMYEDFKNTTKDYMDTEFLTKSKFESMQEENEGL